LIAGVRNRLDTAKKKKALLMNRFGKKRGKVDRLSGRKKRDTRAAVVHKKRSEQLHGVPEKARKGVLRAREGLNESIKRGEKKKMGRGDFPSRRKIPSRRAKKRRGL